MEYLFDWVLPLWLASWLFIMWQIYVPAIGLVRELDINHAVYRWRYITFLVWCVMSFICVPLMLVAALVEKYRKQFIYNYLKHLLDKEDEREN